MNDNECIVCFESNTNDNYFYFNYPIKELSEYYKCNCKSLAHNNCIQYFIKCPMCNKIFKPDTVVHSKYDKYFDFIHIYFHIEPIFIYNNIKYLSLLLDLIMCKMIYDNFINKNNINLFYIINRFFIIILAIFIACVRDYINKYWIF